MRIAILVTDLTPPRLGGISRVATSLAENLVALGHEVDVFCLPRSAELHQNQSYGVIPVKPRWKLYDDYPVVSFSMAAFSLLLSEHKKRPYDVSHAMNFNNFGLTFFRRGMTKLGLAHVSTGFETTQMELAAKWREFVSSPSFHNFAQMAMEAWLAPWQRSYIGWGDVITTEDVETKRNFEKIGLDGSKIELIPSGVDLNEILNFKNVSDPFPSLPSGSKILLCPGRVDPRKGSQYLLRAFAELKQELSHWMLIFAGGGRGSYLDMMRSMVRELDLGDRVQFLGRVEDLKPYYAMCDAVAIPSLSEGIPITLQDALAFGRPIWCSRLEGTHHWAGHLPSIRWCEAGEVSSWVNSLRELKGWDERDLALEQNQLEAGKKWMAEYDWRGVAASYAKAYERARDLVSKKIARAKQS